ncbi:unnamed protein product [Lupinus luteus]|uniref:Protein IQ-DOMAIN 1 n=1 Tax=Lupinus luteus TaxID=3873 RepID=A0AAV1VV71_LUPLU
MMAEEFYSCQETSNEENTLLQDPYDDDEEETLSLSDLPIYSDAHSISSAQWSHDNSNKEEGQNSQNGEDYDDFFEFFSEELTTSTHNETAENIIFCGKLIPIFKDLPSHEKGKKLESKNNIQKKVTKEAKSYTSEYSSSSRKVSLVRLTSKSRWFLFMFGMSRFSSNTEMELEDIRSRQRRSRSRRGVVAVNMFPAPEHGGEEAEMKIKELNMGRKGSWFSTVKKALNGSDSRKKQKQKQKFNKSNLGCFGYHEALESGSEEARAPVAVIPSLPPRKEVVLKPRETENEQSKQALSLVLATAVAAGAAVAAASAVAASASAASASASAAEVARLNTVSRYAGKSREEVSAIEIQTAFRRYSARRLLRGMRGWVRLKRLIQGQSVKRQTTTALKCMQAFSRLQSQIHARRIRMSEENQALQRQLIQKREKELEKLQAAKVAEKWDASLKSKEQIEAKMLHKQVAAMRREKALAYSLSHQQTWRNSPKSANATFMDPNDPHWGWNWLERWMASRPWEGQSIMQHNDHAYAKSASSYATMSVGEITQLYSLRDQNHHDSKNYSPATNQKVSHVHSHSNSASASKAIAKVKASTSQGGSWGGNGDDSRSMFRINHQSNRRHSIAISAVRDDESLASSPAFRTQIPSIKVAKSKSQIPSPFNNKGTILEKGGAISAKRRLSFSPSPSGARRHSVSAKVGNVSNKSIANPTIPEERKK